MKLEIIILNNLKGFYFFRDYKNSTVDYASIKFVEIRDHYNLVHWDIDTDESYYLIYDSEKNFATFSYDKNDNEKIVNLKSARNQLRSYAFPIHEHLPFAMLPNEKKTEKENLYFGIELEVGYQRNCPKNKIHQLIEEKFLKGLAICKSDGSVNNGFEINTVPMTFNYIKTSNIFFDFFDKDEKLVAIL